ncbi:MAG: COG1361 S-layer family protein [Halanaeroarchaeum sp.]
MTYEYDNDEKTTTTVYATVRVEDRATFDLQAASGDLSVDDQGTVTVRLQNDGSEAAAAATVHVQSSSANLRFGQTASASSFVGSWAINETKTVEFDANAPRSADPGRYSFDVSVTYTNTDGIDRRSVPKTAGVTVAPESDHFSFTGVDSTLRVGEEGAVSMTVTNEGERANDTVIRLGATGPNVHPLVTEYAVGSMGAGESTAVSFPIEVSGSGEATPRQLTFTVAYENGDGDQREEAGSTRVEVAPERDQFTVEPVNTTVEAGSTGVVTFAVTNNGGQTVSNVDAKLFANDPLSAAGDEAYVDRIEPGQTERISFTIGAAGTARAKSYPVSVDFQYEADGDSKLSKAYQLPVEVTPSGGRSVPTVAIVGAIAFLVIVGGVLWYRRQ